MGHAHCTSGAPTCSEIPHSLAWSRKAPIIHDVPRGGTVQVLTNRDVKPSGRVLQLCPAFCLREARWWLQLEVRKTSNLHYTTALHTISPVFSHHPTISHHTTFHTTPLLSTNKYSSFSPNPPPLPPISLYNILSKFKKCISDINKNRSQPD